MVVSPARALRVLCSRADVLRAPRLRVYSLIQSPPVLSSTPWLPLLRRCQMLARRQCLLRRTFYHTCQYCVASKWRVACQRTNLPHRANVSRRTCALCAKRLAAAGTLAGVCCRIFLSSPCVLSNFAVWLPNATSVAPPCISTFVSAASSIELPVIIDSPRLGAVPAHQPSGDGWTSFTPLDIIREMFAVAQGDYSPGLPLGLESSFCRRQDFCS